MCVVIRILTNLAVVRHMSHVTQNYRTTEYCRSLDTGNITVASVRVIANLSMGNIVCSRKGITSIEKTALYRGNLNSTMKVKLIDFSLNYLRHLVPGTLDFPELEVSHSACMVLGFFVLISRNL